MKDPGGTIGGYMNDPGTCPGGSIVYRDPGDGIGGSPLFDPGTGGINHDPGTGGH